MPFTNFSSTPSTSRYWLSRNFTSACAVVSLSLPMMHNPYCSVFVCGVAPMPPGPSFTSLE
ncbi:hypothetical protein FPK83_27700, partial [Acinetobacter baumannii]|nr:hypothetical protein [Acinetobacter baumannii]